MIHGSLALSWQWQLVNIRNIRPRRPDVMKEKRKITSFLPYAVSVAATTSLLLYTALQTKDSFLVNKRELGNKIFWQKTLHCRNGLALVALVVSLLESSTRRSCKLWSRIWDRDNAATRLWITTVRPRSMRSWQKARSWNWTKGFIFGNIKTQLEYVQVA